MNPRPVSRAYFSFLREDIDRLFPEIGPGEAKMPVDRVENWKKFSQHMEEYIRERTVNKYKAEDQGGLDLMSVTHEPRICVWNVLKYALRIWNKGMKEHDLEKIAHYAEMAWNMRKADEEDTNNT